MTVKKLYIALIFYVFTPVLARGQSGTHQIDFTVNYTIKESCTIDFLPSDTETYNVTVPWSENVTYNCSPCASIRFKLTDVSSLTVTSEAATFYPSPNGKLVHHPKLRTAFGNENQPTLNITLSSYYEDVTRYYTIFTSGQVTVYSGLPITEYTGTARITYTCSD